MFYIIIEESIYIIFLEIISFVLSPQKFFTILGHLYEFISWWYTEFTSVIRYLILEPTMSGINELLDVISLE